MINRKKTQVLIVRKA